MKLVYGHGINDANYKVQLKVELPKVNGKRKQKVVWTCPFYVKWKDMLSRCYNQKYKAKQPTYADVTCCTDWLYFSKFKTWMEEQDWQGKYLDKDILLRGNKTYSPETCAFVDRVTNNFLTDRVNHRGDCSVGVREDKNYHAYIARCSNPFTLKFEYLGRYSTEEDAHEAWRAKKHEHACKLAELQQDSRVAEALRVRFLK